MRTPTSTKRFIIGGIGGLAPVFALLVAVDFEKNFVTTSTSQVMGYGVRTLALFAIGGFVAWLHESEDKLFKLFEIGLGAPALIAGLITTTSISSQPQAALSATAERIAFSIIPSAHAQPAPSATRAPGAKTFSLPKVSQSSQFFEGLVGVRGGRPTDVYFVIAGSHRTFPEAQRHAAQLNSQHRDIQAEVYAPYADNPHYAVVIGSNLKKANATALRAKAVDSGLPSSTHIWTTPGLRY